MALPFFYIAEFTAATQTITLDEDTSRHIIQVLRMKAGELLNLTDGKGSLLTCAVTEEHKKHCIVAVKEVKYQAATTNKVSIAISLIKNASRFEWFLEKATEIGVHTIIPLLCERTEKEKFRSERLQGICVSAMLQSQQVWLPLLHQPIAYELLFRQEDIAATPHRFIAHCLDDDKRLALPALIRNQDDLVFRQSIMLIGPEGDFTGTEIDLALQQGFQPVTLGNTRLRTETAGIVAASLLKIG